MPQYDNILLGHDDRSRMQPEHSWAMAREDLWLGHVLLDGLRCGTWRVTGTRSLAVLRLKPLTPWTDADRAAIETEGANLLTLLHVGAVQEVREVREGREVQ